MTIGLRDGRFGRERAHVSSGLPYVGQSLTASPVAASNRSAAASTSSSSGVRQRSEFTAGRVAGAVNAELGLLAEGQMPELPDGVVVMCGHGERAMTAASLLERPGCGGISVAVGGPDDWARSSGQALEADR